MIPVESSPVFWRTVLDIMSEGLVLLDRGGRIIFMNKSMEVLTGYSREELVGQHCAVLDFDCFPGTDPGEASGPCPLFEQGYLTNKYCSLKRKDGAHLTVVKNARVLKDHKGRILCALEIHGDVTGLQQNRREISQLRQIIRDRQGLEGIIGASSAMQNLLDLVKKAARSDAPVLIYGESGTGKELVAGAIHRLGRKSSGPFIRVNCAALSESLLESELFGHVKGAFTGAERTTKGRFEAADGGGILLDEVGDMPLSTQVKLLRVIQEKEFERVGDYRPVPIDVRVIAASHRDLRALVRKGLFREDLFYRLNVIPIHVPPLRDRQGDVPRLTAHFICEASARTGKQIRGVDREAMDLLTRHSWPGNVRELINIIEYAFVVCSNDVITKNDLPEVLINPFPEIAEHNGDNRLSDEKLRLVEALIMAKGQRSAAARILGVSRQTVWNWIKKYGIDVNGLSSQPAVRD